MTKPRQPRVVRRLSLLAACIWLAGATEAAFAQAGQNAEGGSLGGRLMPVSPAHSPSHSRPKPVRRAAPSHPAPPSGGGVAAYDGAWSVSAGGACASGGANTVTISHGRVIGQAGVTGHVSPSGVVATLSVVNGITIEGRGRISGNTASGIYRQSDGCTGPWSAVRL